jgi:hypothetical protein
VRGRTKRGRKTTNLRYGTLTTAHTPPLNLTTVERQYFGGGRLKRWKVGEARGVKKGGEGEKVERVGRRGGESVEVEKAKVRERK